MMLVALLRDRARSDQLAAQPRVTRGRDDAVDELGRLERLGQVVERAGAHAARPRSWRCASADSMITEHDAPDSRNWSRRRGPEMPGKSTSSSTTSHGACRDLELVEDRDAIGRGLELDELVLELARDGARDRGDHRLIIVDDQDLDRIRAASSGRTQPLPGSLMNERRTIGLSTIHDPTVVRLAGQAAKIQSEATLTVRSLGVLVEQVGFDFGWDDRDRC